MSAPILTERDRAFLYGESEYDRKRLPEGREAELRELAEWVDEVDVNSFLTLVIFRCPPGDEGRLYACRQHVNPGEEAWFDDEPLRPVGEKTETKVITTYTNPDGSHLDWLDG